MAMMEVRDLNKSFGGGGMPPICSPRPLMICSSAGYSATSGSLRNTYSTGCVGASAHCDCVPN